MKCAECGEIVSADDAFCRACGNKVAQTSLTDSGTALEIVDKDTSGRLGYWGLGLAIVAPLLGYVLTLLPAGLEATLGAIAIIAMAVAGLLGLLLSVVALGFQRGAANKAAGALTLAGFAVFYFFIDQQDDHKLDRVTIIEGISYSNPARTSVAIYFSETGKFPNSNEQAQMAEPQDFASDNVRTVTVGENGIITIEYGGTKFDGQTIVYRPMADASGNIFWDCYGGSIPHNVRPSNCREPVTVDTVDPGGH